MNQEGLFGSKFWCVAPGTGAPNAIPGQRRQLMAPKRRREKQKLSHMEEKGEADTAAQW